MKHLLFLCVALSITAISLAQPISGFRVGANFTFMESVSEVNTYTFKSGTKTWTENHKDEVTFSPAIGFELGYVWKIKMVEHVYFSCEALFTQKSAKEKKVSNGGDVGEEKKSAYLIGAPLALNFSVDKFYAGLGYQYDYNLSDGGLVLNQNNHSVFGEIAYRLKPALMLQLRYGQTLNQEETTSYFKTTGDDINTPLIPKNSNFQIAFIFKFKKKEKVEEENWFDY